MVSPSAVDDLGMPPSVDLARASATDGAWMDVPMAALYAGVSPTELIAALVAGELASAATFANVATVLVHSHAVELWALERESVSHRTPSHRTPLAS
jgi:hypothetical protein